MFYNLPNETFIMQPESPSRTARRAGILRTIGKIPTRTQQTCPLSAHQSDTSGLESIPEEAGAAEEVLHGDRPPTYIIDLSLPPRQRYQAMAIDYRERVQDLPNLFTELLELTQILPVHLTTALARRVLRKLHSHEQNEEIKGISEVTGIDLWLLVALNVLLDLMMGCTSGSMRVRGFDGATSMMHFRTLDWGMEPLRDIIVHLKFIDRPGRDVVAESVTYVGFVGVLTGVRKGLSVSLNFRPQHNGSSPKYYLRILLVLLGLQPSIASRLRELILPPSPLHPSHRHNKQSAGLPSPPTKPPTLPSILSTFPSLPTTAAYIILCDGDIAAILEKDHTTANTLTSPSFLIATNHDLLSETDPEAAGASSLYRECLQESIERKQSMSFKWEDFQMRRCIRYSSNWDSTESSADNENQGGTGGNEQDDGNAEGGEESMAGKGNHSTDDDDGASAAASFPDLLRWLQDYPTVHTLTHYAAVMDPRAGTIPFLRRYAVRRRSRRSGEAKR